jgi:O-antigen/teichoic acid export membrane protein
MGAFWALVGAVLSQGLVLAASVVVARLLGQVGFGELGIIRSTVAMLEVVAGIGLDITATKYVATLCKQDRARTGRILGLVMVTASLSGGVVSLLLFGFAPLLAAEALNSPNLVVELRLGSGLLFFSALNGAQLGALAGFEAFKTMAWVNFARGLLNFPLMVAGVWLFGLRGGVGAMALVAAAGWWLNQSALRQECRRANVTITYHDLTAELKLLWQFSLPAFLATTLVSLATWVTHTMLVNQPNGYAEMGIFNAVLQWRAALVFLPTLITVQVLLPVLSNLYGEQRPARYQKTLWAGLGFIATLALAIATPIILAASLIMSAYGPDFAGSADVLVLMAITTVLSSSLGVMGVAISSMGKMWHGFGLNLFWTFMLVVFTHLFISRGAYGLALAQLLSFSIYLVLATGYIVILLRHLLTTRQQTADGRPPKK